MAPKIKFTKQQIVEEAFTLAVEEGLSEISVRKLAARLGCSIAPIYVNFNGTDELLAAVKEEITSRLWTYSTKMYTNLGFYNIGIGQILFAKDYPNLMRDLITHNICQPTPEHEVLASMLKIMRNDSLLNNISDAQLTHLLSSMSYLTTGICIELMNAPSAADRIGDYIHFLGLAGSQLIYAAMGTNPEELMQVIQWHIDLDTLKY